MRRAWPPSVTMTLALFTSRWHDAEGVRGGEPVGHLQRDVGGLRHREPSGGEAALEVHSLRESHDDEDLVADLLHRIDRADVRVVESRRRLGLPQQSPPVLLTPDRARREELERHLPVEVRSSAR